MPHNVLKMGQDGRLIDRLGKGELKFYDFGVNVSKIGFCPMRRFKEILDGLRRSEVGRNIEVKIGQIFFFFGSKM